jgi:hypothetical protein
VTCCPKCDCRLTLVTVRDRTWLTESCPDCGLVLAHTRRPGHKWPDSAPGSPQAAASAHGRTITPVGTAGPSGGHGSIYNSE